jgi:hypothetical protein
MADEPIALDANAYREVPDDEMTEVGEADQAEEDAPAPPDGDLRQPEWAEQRTVTVYDRDFVIGQPNLGITLRIINVMGQVGVRGERVAMRALQSLARGAQQAPTPSSRAALFGMLAALSVEDVIALGSAVLQFDDDREGRGWLRKGPDGQQLPLSPIVRALFLNIMQSEDLRDCLTDFFDGLRMTESLFSGLSIDLD